MTVALTEWNAALRGLFGWSLLSHPARLRDGIELACRARHTTEEALFAAIARGERAAVTALARSLTVGETYFFREPRHFDLLRHLLPSLVAAAGGSRKVVLVSAACASGEEAYSMAMVAREVLGAQADALVRILALDVNDTSLAQAARATYRPWSMRGLPVETRRAWFEETEGGAHVVKSVRQLVTFAHENLMSPTGTLEAGTVDVLFCRNALIYFDAAVANEVVHRLAAALVPEGVLVLGTAESGFLTAAGLATHTLEGVTVHVPARAKPPDARRRAEEPASVLPPKARPRVRAHVAASRPKAAATRLTKEPAEAPAVAEDTLSAEDYATRGFQVLDADPQQAAADARRALLLDRTLIAGHVLTASVAAATGDVDGAGRAVARARRLLATLPDCSMVPATGATKEQMLAYCQRLSRAFTGR